MKGVNCHSWNKHCTNAHTPNLFTIRELLFTNDPSMAGDRVVVVIPLLITAKVSPALNLLIVKPEEDCGPASVLIVPAVEPAMSGPLFNRMPKLALCPPPVMTT